jgi:hypothetical protein
MSGKKESNPPKGEMESTASADRTQNIVLPEVVEALSQEGAQRPEIQMNWKSVETTAYGDA